MHTSITTATFDTTSSYSSSSDVSLTMKLFAVAVALFAAAGLAGAAPVPNDEYV